MANQKNKDKNKESSVVSEEEYDDCDTESDSDDSYDLVSVSNHHGGLHGGHYTAYCKNHRDSKWYHFDDSRVSEVDEKEVKENDDAYVLFYCKRSYIKDMKEMDLELITRGENDEIKSDEEVEDDDDYYS
eukprot:Awhi_evm1s7176